MLRSTRYLKAVNEGKVQSTKDAARMPVSMGLQGEIGFPHQGTVNLVNNQSNAATGTTLLRAVFPNPAAQGGPATDLARYVRQNPPADQPATSGTPGA